MSAAKSYEWALLLASLDGTLAAEALAMTQDFSTATARVLSLPPGVIAALAALAGIIPAAALEAK